MLEGAICRPRKSDPPASRGSRQTPRNAQRRRPIISIVRHCHSETGCSQQGNPELPVLSSSRAVLESSVSLIARSKSPPFIWVHLSHGLAPQDWHRRGSRWLDELRDGLDRSVWQVGAYTVRIL